MTQFRYKLPPSAEQADNPTSFVFPYVGTYDLDLWRVKPIGLSDMERYLQELYT